MSNKDLFERCRSEHFGFISISVNVLHASVLALSFNKLVYGYIFLNQSKINVFSLIFLNFVIRTKIQYYKSLLIYLTNGVL